MRRTRPGGARLRWPLAKGATFARAPSQLRSADGASRRFGVEPAAVNPLVTYLLPFVIEAVLELFGVSLPSVLRAGLVGVLWSATYTIAILGAAYLLNRWNVRLAL